MFKNLEHFSSCSYMECCFKAWYSWNACQNSKQGRPRSDWFIRSSLIWVCAVCIGPFDRQLVFKILGHIPYILIYLVGARGLNFGQCLDLHPHFVCDTGTRSTVCNVSGNRCESDCRSRGHKFDPSLVPYFHGDWSWNNFYGHLPPFRWIIQEGLLSVTSEGMCMKYWIAACSSLRS